MKVQRPFSVKGVGIYLPKLSVESSEIEKELKLPKGYIYKHTGVKSRYKASEESNTYMGVQALKAALKDANLDICNIDCLIGASATFDYIIPNRSSLIKNAFDEAKGLDFLCIDINTVCTSFISALDYASLLLATGDYKNIAIVSSEKSIQGLNPDDVETYSLFGDGAASIIVSNTEQDAGLIHSVSKTYSEGAKYTIIEGGGNENHTKDTPYDPELYSFKMKGKKLLKSVMSTLPEYLDKFFEDKMGIDEVNLIVPHQASKLGLKILKSMNVVNPGVIVDNLETHGNCIAASIPIALATSIRDNRLREGDTCFLLGTAAGLTISGLLFKYSAI